MAGPQPAAPGKWSWQNLMAEALVEAKKAALAGEVPVGALVVDGHGHILARAHNRMIRSANPAAHAEVLALRAAGQACGKAYLADCVLVVSLEPCLMCAGAIALWRLAGLVYGAADNRAGAISSMCDYLALPLANANIWHMGGYMAEESAELLKTFFERLRN